MTKYICVLPVVLFLYCQLKAQDNGDTGFKPSGKVWGLAFGDYFMKIHADSLNRGNTQYAGLPENSNTFDFRRVFFGYDYNISEKFSSEFLISYESTYLSDNLTRAVLLKAANLRWKNIFRNTELIIGQSATPAFSATTEKFWGYRSVEKTIVDMRGACSSNDLGIALKTTLVSNENTEAGIHLLVGNGTAQKIETDVFKRIYGGFYALLFKKNLLIDLYADYTKTQLTPYHKSKMLLKGAVCYKSETFAVGLEVFNQFLENNVVLADSVSGSRDTTNAISLGLSAFARYCIMKDKLWCFARYDLYNPFTEYNNEKYYFAGNAPNTEAFVTLGFDIMPHKNVHIIPNIWYNAYYNRSKDVSGAVKTDYDFVARLTLWYVFR